jgi:shikimate dehydrogenase
MSTWRFAVLGDPVEHSRSPEIHTAMLGLSGLEGEYRRIRADARDLAATIEDLRKGVWHGLNTTMPLKGEAARLADSLSPRAERAGSVNTLAMRGSNVYGETTDSSAFHQLFSSERFRQIGSILVLGAGGSAAAALIAAPEDRNVYVEARRPDRAADLTGRFGGTVAPWGAAIAGALVVNTTPIGMSAESLPEPVVQTAAGLIDLPYAASATRAITVAIGRGIPHADGNEFLVRQAIASFALWTGVEIQYDDLVETLRNG